MRGVGDKLMQFPLGNKRNHPKKKPFKGGFFIPVEAREAPSNRPVAGRAADSVARRGRAMRACRSRGSTGTMRRLLHTITA